MANWLLMTTCFTHKGAVVDCSHNVARMGSSSSHVTWVSFCEESLVGMLSNTILYYTAQQLLVYIEYPVLNQSRVEEILPGLFTQAQ